MTKSQKELYKSVLIKWGFLSQIDMMIQDLWNMV